MKREAQCVQRRTRIIPVRITWSAGTPSIAEGTGHITIADTGPGIVTVTYVTPFARQPVLVPGCVITTTGDALLAVFRAPAVTGVIVEISDDAGTLADPTALHFLIWGFDTADAN